MNWCVLMSDPSSARHFEGQGGLWPPGFSLSFDRQGRRPLPELRSALYKKSVFGYGLSRAVGAAYLARCMLDCGSGRLPAIRGVVSEMKEPTFPGFSGVAWEPGKSSEQGNR